MIPIRKVKDRAKPWLLDLRSVGGGREFFATRQEAENARAARVEDVKAHGASGLDLTSAERAEYATARDQLREVGATVPEAVRFFLEHRRQPSCVQMSVAIRECLKVKDATNKRARYLEQLGYTLRGVLASFGGRDPFVDRVSQGDLVAWLHGNGWAPASIRTKRIDLQTFFRWCQRRGWLEKDPTAGIERERLDEKAPGILSVTQAERLMNACQARDAGLLGYLALALFAGVRPAELDLMRAEHVQPDRGFVEVAAFKAKSRQRRLVDLSPNCLAWLGVAREAEWPVKNSRGRMNAVRIEAGFCGSWKEQRNGWQRWRPVPGDAWPQDVLRHSFASYHLAMHGSADKTAHQLGHGNTAMLVRHYRELVTKADAERFWGIVPRTLVECGPGVAQPRAAESLA